MGKSATILWLVTLTIGCAPHQGASQTPPTANSSGDLASAASPPEPAAQSAETAKPRVEDQRESFMQGCMGKAHMPDYCECAFDQFRAVFKDVDLSKPLPKGDPHLKTLQEKTVLECASKLDEAQVKGIFIDRCQDGNQKRAKYCTCAWPALRKHLSLGDFMGDAETPRFIEAKKDMVVVCKGKNPTGLAKSEFMSGCTKDQSDRKEMCECLWKKVKAKISAEELAAGTVDVKTVPGLSECKK